MPGRLTRRTFLQHASTVTGAALGVAGTNPLPSLLGADKEFRGKFSICNETFGKWEFPKAFA